MGYYFKYNGWAKILKSLNICRQECDVREFLYTATNWCNYFGDGVSNDVNIHNSALVLWVVTLGKKTCSKMSEATFV